MLSCSCHVQGLVAHELFASLMIGKNKKGLVYCEAGSHYFEVVGETDTLVWARIALGVADTLIKLHPARGTVA